MVKVRIGREKNNGKSEDRMGEGESEKNNGKSEDRKVKSKERIFRRKS